MDPPQKYDFVQVIAKSIKSHLYHWVKIIKFHLKWVKMGPLRLRIYFLGYFDMGISVLILPDSLDSVFGSFLRISWPMFFGKSPILPLYRALSTPWKGLYWPFFSWKQTDVNVSRKYFRHRWQQRQVSSTGINLFDRHESLRQACVSPTGMSLSDRHKSLRQA